VGEAANIHNLIVHHPHGHIIHRGRSSP